MSSCKSKVSKLAYSDSGLKAWAVAQKQHNQLQNKFYLGLSLVKHGFTAVIKSFS